MKKYTLSQIEAAKTIGVCSETMRLWRLSGKGPAFIETPNGRVRYPVTELEEFMKPKQRGAA